jgi:hypothetical protein
MPERRLFAGNQQVSDTPALLDNRADGYLGLARTCRTKRDLQNVDTFRAGLGNLVDMPERTLNNLLGFLRQNGGQLSRRALEGEFAT